MERLTVERTPEGRLTEMRALAARAKDLNGEAEDLAAALERGLAELARVRGRLLRTALRDAPGPRLGGP